MSEEKSRWQKEFDVLPEWAQKMVRAASKCGMHGGVSSRDYIVGFTNPERYSATAFMALFETEADEEWTDGFYELLGLARALTAPWPPPEPPARERRAFNIVELISDDEEEGGFDRLCCFANRVPGHAVYCHNEAWPNSPRKCYRDNDDSWTDCPGFVKNPDVAAPPPGAEG